MNKLFTQKQVSLSALIGGPIPSGILIFMNYWRLDKKEKARTALITTFVLTIVFFVVLFQLPEKILDSIPNTLFSALYAAIVYIYFRHYMTKEIEIGFNSGHTKASNWSVAWVTALGLIGTIAIIFVIVLIQPSFPGEKIEINGNEVYFSGESTKQDAEILASILFEIEYFGDGFENIAQVDKSGSKYFINIPLDKEVWNDSGVIEVFTNIKLVLEQEYGSSIELTFEHYTLNGKTERKTL